MDAWADLTIDVRMVRGLAQYYITDRQRASFDASEVGSEDRVEAAKGKLEDVLMTDGNMSQYVDDAGGPDALLDALANESTLESRLDRGLALAFLSVYGPDTAIVSGSRRQERADGFEDELMRWARSFGEIASYQLGYTTTSTRTSSSGAFAQTMGTWDKGGT
jgi:hypothetical protein